MTLRCPWVLDSKKAALAPPAADDRRHVLAGQVPCRQGWARAEITSERVVKRPSCAARGTAPAGLLNRWTLHGAVRAEHAAVARLRAKKCFAAGTFMKIHARIGGHHLSGHKPAAWASQFGFQDRGGFHVQRRLSNRDGKRNHARLTWKRPVGPRSGMTPARRSAWCFTAASARTLPTPGIRACTQRSARVPRSVGIGPLAPTRRRDWRRAIGAW